MSQSTPAADNFISKYNEHFKINNINSLPLLTSSNTTDVHLNIANLSVDFNKQVVYDSNKVQLNVNDYIYLVNDKIIQDPYTMGRITKFIPKPEYAGMINKSSTNIFPAYTTNLIINILYRNDDTTKNSRELICSSYLQVMDPVLYKGHFNLNFKDSIPNLSDYIKLPDNFYFHRFFDRFSGEYLTTYSIEHLLQKFDSSYLKLLQKKAPFLYSEKEFPLMEYLNFFLNGNVSNKNWRQQCNTCYKWCNYKQNLVKCDTCKENFHIYCVSETHIDRSGFDYKNWHCKKCANGVSDIHLFEQKYGLDIMEKELYAEKLLPIVEQNFNNSEKYMCQYIGFTNAESFANDYNNYVIADYWHPLKEIEVNQKKCQYLAKDEPCEFERGTDDTITPIWKSGGINEKQLHQFVDRCVSEIPRHNNFSSADSSFYDHILSTLYSNNYDYSKSFQILKCTSTKDLKIPQFSDQELSLFQNGIKKYGGDPYKIYKYYLKDYQSLNNVVRFFYVWKKTKNGLITRGKYTKKQSKTKEVVSNLTFKNDIYCFDIIKFKEYSFACDFCNTSMSPMWYKNGEQVDQLKINKALCVNCGTLWKKYATVWKPLDLVLKQFFGRTNFKRFLEIILINDKYNSFMKEININSEYENELLMLTIKHIKYYNKLFKNFDISKIKRENENISGQYTKTLYTNRKVNVDKNMIPFQLESNALVYSIKMSYFIDNNDYSLFIDNNYDSIFLTSENILLVKNNIDSKRVSVQLTSPTKTILENYKKLKQNQAFSMLTVDVNNLDAINPLDSQILMVFKSLIVQLFNKLQQCIHNNVNINPIRKYLSSINPNMRTSCSICLMEFEDLSEEIICNNCGMNCHYYCYGEPKSQNNNACWECELCVNNEDDKSCELCVINELDTFKSRQLEENCVPDALKLTTNKDYVHVICALFNNVPYGSNKMSPFIMVNNINKHKCSICSSKRGNLVKCKLCNIKVHITCCQDEDDYKIGFLNESDINPIILCNNHITFNLFPLDHKYMGISLWKRFLNHKLDCFNGSAKVKFCHRCNVNNSLYWYKEKDHIICKNCHLNDLFAKHKIIQNLDTDDSDVTFWEEYPIDKFYIK